VDLDERPAVGQARERVGHADGHALVQGQHELDLGIVPERVHESLPRCAGIAEHVTDSVGQELLDHTRACRSSSASVNPLPNPP